LGAEVVAMIGGQEMGREYAVDPMGLADKLGIPRDEASVLLEGADHDYYCRCDACREMWRKIGPDPDTDRYGPFTEEEIDGSANRSPLLQ